MARDVFRRLSDEQKAHQRRAAINQTNRSGTNMFFEAIESGKLDEVYKLFHDGARLDTRTATRGFFSTMLGGSVPYAVGATPLHAACLLGSPAIVSFLIDQGADVHVRDHEGQTPLDYAILGHSYHEQEFNRKLSSRFAFQSTVEKAQTKVENFESVVLKLMKRGAKPGMFSLPDKFKAVPPAGGKPPSL